jgi:hypothetical protein
MFKLFLTYIILIITLSPFISCSKVIQLEILKNTRSNKLNRILTETDIPLVYENNEDYFTVALGIGNPAQYFAVQVDTTTSVTWVPSINCKHCNSTTKFNSSLSSTVRDTNKTVEIEDKDGDVKGLETFDNIVLNGFNLSEYGFVQVVKYDDDYKDYEDGKLGLGFRHEHGHNFNFLEKLKTANLIEKKIFSISEKNTTHGILHLGDYPSEYDNITYTFSNLTTTEGLDDEYRSGWVTELTHVIIGDENKTFAEATEISGRVIIDSTYSYISAPKSFLQNFKTDFFEKYFVNQNSTCKEYKSDDEISFICPKIELQDVSFTFILGGWGYVLEAEDLFENIDHANMEFLVRFNKEDDNIWRFGHPFASRYTIVFNGEDNHVGFYGGERKSFVNEWTLWYGGESFSQKQNRMFLLIVGASVLGAILLIVILFLIVHSIKRRRLEGEHGPLINEGRLH